MARTGRPREFDKDQVLEKAMGLFWARGYGATSVQDLVDALALERGSLYAAFGDKRHFYLAAVKLYWDTCEGRLLSALDAGPVLPALRELLAYPGRLDELTTEVGTPQGCLMGNTSAELVPHDSDARQLVAYSYERFTRIVADGLKRAQEAGEVVGTSSPEAQARLLLFIAQGYSLVSRSGIDAETSFAAVDAAIEGLRVRPQRAGGTVVESAAVR